MTEKELAERAAKRDKKAFGELYDRYIDKLYKYIYFKCRSTEEAEDLTSQVFMKAWEAIENYRWEGYPFSTWLFRIAHNQIVDYYRTHRSNVPLDAARTTHKGPDPFDIIQNSMTGEQIRAAIKHLTDSQQRVIILRFIEGYGIAEIADLMDKDPAAIRAIQHRALRALQPWLTQERTIQRVPAAAPAASE